MIITDPGNADHEEGYVFAGLAPSLPADLMAHGTDLYVSSYPVNGGKANLEAMLLGLPVVVPEDPGLDPLLRFSLPLPVIKFNEPFALMLTIF